MTASNWDLYFRFVKERHAIWCRRGLGRPQPWTTDPVLRTKKFTNVFRILDPGSQFVLKGLLGDPAGDPRDFLARCFLYRHTNLPSAWAAWEVMNGVPTLDDLDGLKEFWLTYRASGGQVFSGAYMIFPQTHQKGSDKVEQVVDLTKRVMADPAVMKAFQGRSLPKQFEVLVSHRGVGNFMAMQIMTDWGYGPWVTDSERENRFVVAGPGARKGAQYLDPSKKAEELIWQARELLFDTDVKLTTEGGLRPLSLMDVQNTFCEFSKYMRRREKWVPSTASSYKPSTQNPQDYLVPDVW